MATNPLFSTNQSSNNVTAPSKAVNNVTVDAQRTHNTFDNSYFHFLTQTFGYYQPFHVEKGVPGDVIPFASSHNVRSLPFAAPLLSPMRINKDYFLIPNYAIQPYTWDYIFRSPAQGDDVPDDAQNLFPIGRFLTTFMEYFGSFHPSTDVSLDSLFAFLIAENFLSCGSVLSSLGYKHSARWLDPDTGVSLSFDDFFDLVFRRCDISVKVSIDDRSLYFTTQDGFPDRIKVDVYEALTIIRTFPSNIIEGEVFFNDATNTTTYLLDLSIPKLDYNSNIRLDKLIAYQLACSTFYVNPNVDFIYQSQLYRDNYMTNLRNLGISSGISVNLDFFEYNGISIQYDYFSKHYYDQLVDIFEHSLSMGDPLNEVFATFAYFTSFREQLRFGDYFTGSRTQALGFGPEDSDGVAVVDNSVSVIDMSQRIILQRFRNNTIKIGNDTDEYLKSIFGEELPPDFHLPKLIVHTEFAVNGEEISNTTSDDQGNIVTNLKSGSDSTAYEVKCSLPCVLLGISYISLPRVYSQTKDRDFFHQDRYDMFNPTLQYFGDQALYGDELNSRFTNLVFAYHSRNEEYKQRVSIATGGFCTNVLKSWAFVTDSDESGTRSLMFGHNQSPSFIRAYPFEFNRFLTKQPGISLANRYHFIVTYNNKSVQNRPMEVNPSTL